MPAGNGGGAGGGYARGNNRVQAGPAGGGPWDRWPAGRADQPSGRAKQVRHNWCCAGTGGCGFDKNHPNHKFCGDCGQPWDFKLRATGGPAKAVGTGGVTKRAPWFNPGAGAPAPAHVGAKAQQHGGGSNPRGGGNMHGATAQTSGSSAGAATAVGGEGEDFNDWHPGGDGDDGDAPDDHSVSHEPSEGEDCSDDE